jgi:hypothetical protein
MNRLEAIQRIVTQADRGEPLFPTGMRAAIHLQQALNDPDCHLKAAAQLALANGLAEVPSPLPGSAAAGSVKADKGVDVEIRGRMLPAILAESAGEIRAFTDMLLI